MNRGLFGLTPESPGSVLPLDNRYPQTGQLAAYVGGVLTPSGDITGATDSAAVQAALNASTRPVILSAGTWWLTNIGILRTKKLMSFGSLGDFTNPAYEGACIIKQPTGTSSPCIAMEQGTELVGVTIDGNGVAQVGLDCDAGFEARLRQVRIVNCATTGLLFNSANNIHFEDVYVDSCGSTTAAAVQVRSYSTGGVTNGLNFFGLTVENSAGVGLDIGAGSSTATGSDDYAEFVRIFGAHVEQGSAAYPALSVGNVRAVDLIAPMLVGAPSTAVVLFNQQVATNGSTTVQGGLNVIGGSVVGNATTPTNLIHLQAGDKFSISGGTLLQSCSGAAIQIDSGFGATVNIGEVSQASVGSLFADGRTGGKVARAVAADSAWIAPTFAGTWANSATPGVSAAGYRMLSNNTVKLQGQVTSGTGLIFTLPAGYRPTKSLLLPVVANSTTFGVVEVDANGAVSQVTGTVPLDLENICFPAEL